MKYIDKQRVFLSIDKIKKKIDCVKKEPLFSDEINKRLKRNPSQLKDDNDALRKMARLIAYSQNAKSDLVTEVLNSGIFEKVFKGYKVSKVVKLNSNKLINTYWKDIKAIRFKKKVNAIIKCGKSIVLTQKTHGSFAKCLRNSKIPYKLKEQRDIENFWIGFQLLKKTLKDHKMPFFRSTTSLLHLLLHLGYDCIKPDLIVMKVAKELGIVEKEKGDKNLIKVVRNIQNYSLAKNIKPSIVDFYLLIYGGQKWAKQFVNI